MNDLWNILAGDIGETKIRWFAKAPHGNLGGIVRDPAALERVARLSSQGYNCYVTLNPTNERSCKRINAQDVTKWAFVLLDLDPPPKATEHEALQVAALVARSLSSHHVHPAVIYTGNGVQLWIRLTPRPPEMAREHSRALVKAVAAILPVGWRIDMTIDLARIARMPGSINQRTGGMARIVVSGEVMDYSDTCALLAAFYEPTPPTQSYDPGDGNREWMDVRDELTLRAKSYIDFGCDRGDRHETCHHAIRTMHERGVSKDSALDAALHGNEACVEPLDEREVRQILAQVYKGT